MANDSPERPLSRAVPALLAAVGLASVVGAVGLAARPQLRLPDHTGTDPNAGRDVTLAIAAILVGLVLIGQARRLAAPYQRLVYRLVGAGLVLGPVLVVNVGGLLKNHGRPRPTRTPTPSPPDLTGSGGPGRGSSGGSELTFDSASVIVSAILTFAACALLGYVAYRVIRAQRRPGHHVAPAGSARASDDADVLGRASAAIDLGADPRARVIAAYEAMEAALESPRRAPQAPLEWLEALAARRPAAMEPARELTVIFERARFRTAPVTEADAVQARAALDRLRRTMLAGRA